MSEQRQRVIIEGEPFEEVWSRDVPPELLRQEFRERGYHLESLGEDGRTEIWASDRGTILGGWEDLHRGPADATARREARHAGYTNLAFVLFAAVALFLLLHNL